MKTLKTFILLLAVTLTIPSICACGDDDDNSPIVGPGGNSGKNNDKHEYVDLGLPNGTLWATCNVGASKPEEYGDWFAWGETIPKDIDAWYPEWNNYKYYNETGLYKYNSSDRRMELEPIDDAATVNWGENWQTPSPAQFYDLINGAYTTREWKTLNGVIGVKITSKSNGNSIFLPTSHKYWTRSLDSGSRYQATCFDFFSENENEGVAFYRNHSPRCEPCLVRPVRKK